MLRKELRFPLSILVGSRGGDIDELVILPTRRVLSLARFWGKGGQDASEMMTTGA